MTEIRPFALVLMPFAREFDDIYKLGIKQACIDVGILAERVDEQIYSETMLERIYRQIENADIIIADMTGKNANVFYEVGYAHAKKKMCALITQKKEDIPFDLQQHYHIIYDGRILELKESLKPRLLWMKAELERAKQSSLQVTFKKPYGMLEKSEWMHEGSLDFKMLLKNAGATRSPEIDTISVTVGEKWKLLQNSKECPSDQPEKGKRRFYISPPNTRLAPGALSQIDVEFKRIFWTKWGGEEKSDRYHSKGIVEIEVATSEGTLPYIFDLDVGFDESPF